MSHEVAREALYDRVWKTPLKRLAPEFGVDPVQLSEICRRYGIPIPGSGHWTRVELGKPVEQTPLGAAPDGVGDIVAIAPKPRRVRASALPAEKRTPERKESSTTSAEQQTPEPPPKEASPSEGIHRLVERTRAKLAAGKAGEITRVTGRGLFSAAATPAQADRLARLLSDLVRAVEDRGWTVKPEDTGLKLVPDGEPISLDLTEQTDRVRHSPTEKEQEAVRKHEEKRKVAAKTGRWFSDWDAPKVPEWDYVPNGQLVLKFEEM